MRIALLYQGEYSQWSERFMNYLEEQMDGEAMINSIKNDDQPLPRVTQVSLAGTSSTEQPLLKDKSMWYDQEEKIHTIDHLARYFLIQGLLNDIYSLIDSNKTAKELCDALARHMLGYEYGEQDRKASKKKAVVITSDPLALVTEQTKVSKRKMKVVVFSESEGSDDKLKKITALLVKAFNRKKFYSKLANNNLRTSSATSSANKKQEYVKFDDKKEKKKVDEMKRDMSKVKCYNCKKEGHFDKDCKKAKVKDYEYYKTKIDSDQEVNANMVFMAQLEKVLSDSEASSSSSDDKIAEESYYTSESKSEYEYETLDYYDNSTTYGLFIDNNDDQEIFHDSSEIFSKNLIESQIDHNESDDTLNNGRKGICFENPSYFEKAKDLRPSLYDERVIGLEYTLIFLTHSDEALEIEKFKRARENKIEFAYDYGNLNASYVNEKINFLDDYFQEIINPDFEKIDSLFQQISSLKPLNDSFDENNLFIFDDESVRNSQVSKMSFRKKPRASLNIIDSGCLKHMMGNRDVLTNFIEKFLGTVRFGNNDFALIAGYGDVVIGSMKIKKVYYVEGLGHNLFSVGQFCDKGLEVAFRKSTCFVQTGYGVDLLPGDHSSNLYSIALNEVASNSSACLLAKASSSQSWLWHQRLSHLNFTTINNLVKNNIVQDEASEMIISFIKKTQVNLQLQVQRVRTDNGTEFKNKTLAKFFDEAEAIATACFTQNRLIIHKHFDKTPYKLMNKRKPNIKFFHLFGCRCYLLNDYDDVGKLKAKGDIGVFVGYSKESASFRIYNKRTCKIHESVNVNFDEISEMASKQFSLDPV
nr:integrase, catalytic region, zinc finger, CCHC-type, peptidase aspartic, catalytic [Tanacetum cinerariifolium]